MKTKESSDLFSLRIVLLPEKMLSDEAVSLALQYSKFGETYYFVDDKSYFTHLTIYLGKFSMTVKPKVFKVVEKISRKYSKINLECEKAEMISDWLTIKFQLKDDLKRMREEILGGLNSLGETHTYSTRENYQPHLSLLRYKNIKINSKTFNKKILDIKTNLNLRWNYLAIADDEEHGAVSKVIKKYKLKS